MTLDPQSTGNPGGQPVYGRTAITLRELLRELERPPTRRASASLTYACLSRAERGEEA